MNWFYKIIKVRKSYFRIPAILDGKDILGFDFSKKHRFIARRSLPQKVKIKEIQKQFWSCSACATFSMPTNLDENPDNRRTKKEVHDPFGFTWREIEGRVNNHKGPLCLMRSPSFHTFLYKCPLARKPLWLSTVNPIFPSEKKSSARENIQKHVVYAKKSSHEAIKIFHIQNRSLEKLERKWKMFDDWKFYDAKSHDNYKLIWSLEP